MMTKLYKIPLLEVLLQVFWCVLGVWWVFYGCLVVLGLIRAFFPEDGGCTRVARGSIGAQLKPFAATRPSSHESIRHYVI